MIEQRSKREMKIESFYRFFRVTHATVHEFDLLLKCRHHRLSESIFLLFMPFVKEHSQAVCYCDWHKWPIIMKKKKKKRSNDCARDDESAWNWIVCSVQFYDDKTFSLQSTSTYETSIAYPHDFYRFHVVYANVVILYYICFIWPRLFAKATRHTTWQTLWRTTNIPNRYRKKLLEKFMKNR